MFRRLIKPEILSMQAYHVPPATGLLKLDAMENPYHWPADIKRQWLAGLETVEINRYPDPGADILKKEIKSVMGIGEDLSVMLGNGSDELIQIITLALAQPEHTFMSFEPGFVMYRNISRLVNARYMSVALDKDDFSINREETLTVIEQVKPELIFIACPNNPTGNLFDKNIVMEIVKNSPGLVVIDEAYHSFAGSSFIPDINEFDNVLVMRTFSKSGLAGLRLGYLVGPADWLQELEKVRLPYNINSLTQYTATFILQHYELLEQQARQICQSREKLFHALKQLNGVKVWPSRANFLLFRTLRKDANEIHNGLVQNGVLIRKLHGSNELLENCLRVTVGAEEDNRIFLDTLNKLL